ncbi:hypothetical protein DL96DRAFT_856849 [Flagelloscypha sp. PMI_526]|nr:hypothetical protein DL96DRAFT_856849 [Flagelloscypha sp. PMI_526]
MLTFHSTSIMSQTYTIPGSCLCKSIKFVAKDVDFTDISRCNCTICDTLGRTSVHLKEHGNLVLLKDGKEIPLDAQNVHDFADDGLTAYVHFPEKRVVGEREMYLCFCNRCGVHMFIIGFFKQEEPNCHFVSLNVRSLDVESVGLSMKELSKIENMGYVNVREDKFDLRKGEPWGNGSW